MQLQVNSGTVKDIIPLYWIFLFQYILYQLQENEAQKYGRDF